MHLGRKRMITLPVFTRLKIDNYGLFPGDPAGAGISHQFDLGLTLIAGINGLGKTTILTAILRALTGPFDLTGTGAPTTLGVTVPKNPVELNNKRRKFFAQRVADNAESAQVTLDAEFSSSRISVTRNLSDLSLASCKVDGSKVSTTTNQTQKEVAYQSVLSELMGLGSFVDVLLVLHFVLLFHEDRPGALWDTNAQRQLLRALFLGKDDAIVLSDLERSVQSADSQARNIQTRITSTERELREKQSREAGAKGVSAKLEAEQKLLDAELEELRRFDEVLARLDEERRQVRLENEKAKMTREEASGAIEKLKYDALVSLYPTMDESARLVVARIMTEARCLVCNSEASRKQQELEQQIKEGFCPACGAENATQETVVPAHVFEKAKLNSALEQSRLARVEEDQKAKRLKEITSEYESALASVSDIRKSISDRKQNNNRLRSQLPSDTTSVQLEQTLETLGAQRNYWMSLRSEKFENLKKLLAENEELVTSKAEELKHEFVKFAKVLLTEDAQLIEIRSAPKYLQGQSEQQRDVQVPAFQAEMAAANRAGLVRRADPTDVSESQRELIDLAFRLSLVKVATANAPCTFVMETPEASLDGLAMDRVGCALATFAVSSKNRLIVTSNLTNAGLITAIFGGPTIDPSDAKEREARTINLLRVAAPNSALERDRERYEKLLRQAVCGER